MSKDEILETQIFCNDLLMRGKNKLIHIRLCVKPSNISEIMIHLATFLF